MQKDLEKFRNEFGGNIKKAKEANNVIDEPYYNIELDQVSIISYHFLAHLPHYSLVLAHKSDF